MKGPGSDAAAQSEIGAEAIGQMTKQSGQQFVDSLQLTQTGLEFHPLTELRTGVAREYDEVRAYLRSLANLEQKMTPDAAMSHFDTRFRIDAVFSGRGLIVEQVFHRPSRPDKGHAGGDAERVRNLASGMKLKTLGIRFQVFNWQLEPLWGLEQQTASVS